MKSTEHLEDKKHVNSNENADDEDTNANDHQLVLDLILQELPLAGSSPSAEGSKAKKRKSYLSLWPQISRSHLVPWNSFVTAMMTKAT
jgi:hypothetical protein